MGYSPCSRKELNTTEVTEQAHIAAKTNDHKFSSLKTQIYFLTFLEVRTVKRILQK